jgi:ABC-type proline/glycine betaine transport system, ATPase component
MQLMVATLDFFPLIYEAVLLQVHCKMSKIEIKNIYKIFGNKPQSVMQMVKDGATKEEVLEKTGHTVGLDNVSLKIEERETFVCMGLSGSGKSTLIRHLNRLIEPTSGEILVGRHKLLCLLNKTRS